MIEEAAGTRMYESKKNSAQKTIEKKDNKLKEIEIVSLGKRLLIRLACHSYISRYVCMYVYKSKL